MSMLPEVLAYTKAQEQKRPRGSLSVLTGRAGDGAGRGLPVSSVQRVGLLDLHGSGTAIAATAA